RRRSRAGGTRLDGAAEGAPLHRGTLRLLDARRGSRRGQHPDRARLRDLHLPTERVSTTRVRRLPLRGADLVLVAMQALWKPARVSNNTLMAVQCDGPLDPLRVERGLER